MENQKDVKRSHQHANDQEDWNNVHTQLQRVQKKSMAISDPHDNEEKEADTIARKVVNGETASVSGSSNGINRKGMGEAEATPQFQSKLESSKGSGNSLPGDIQQEMGSKMGADFSGVKVHTGGEANSMSESINAKAFTSGQDIYFGSGQFDTNSKQGKELIAHELVHTQQQSQKIQRQTNSTGDFTAANTSYDKWHDKRTEIANHSNAWQTNNWQKFIHDTSYNPALASKDVIRDISGIVFAKLIGKGIEWTGKKIAKKAVKSTIVATATAIGCFGGPVGAVIGFIVGVIIDFIVDLVWEWIWPDRSAEEAVIDNNARSSKLIEQLIIQGSANQDQVLSDDVNERTLYIDNVEKTQANADIAQKHFDDEYEKIKDVKIDIRDESMYLELLRNWTLEHAGETNNADKYVSESQWEKAIEKLKTTNTISNDNSMDTLEGLPRLFAYQFRAEVGRFGLKTDQPAKVINDVLVMLNKKPIDRAETVRAFYDDDENRKNGYTFTPDDIEDPQKFIDHTDETVKDFGYHLSAKAKELIKAKKGFTFKIYLDLETQSNSVEVDDFLYYINFTEPLEDDALSTFEWYSSID
jgi:hypothetical protein